MSLNSGSLRASLSAFTQSVSNRRELSTGQLNTAVELIAKVDAIVEAVQAKEQSIAASTVLSDQGKSAAVAELSTATVPKVTWLSRVVQGHADDLSGTKKTLYVVKPPERFGSDEIMRYHYGAEVRQAYAGLNPNERIAKFVAASQQSDDGILWAMLQAPVPMVPAEILDSALEERARRLNPETMNRLRQVEILHDTLASLLDAVRQWLRSLGGNPEAIYQELGGDEPVLPPMERELARRQAVA